jgi:DNA-binding GntR family transcriptional regulator
VPDSGSTYELLKKAILDGELEPEQKLVETTLATRFSVSRTPIREALSRLEQDGLAERRPRGLFVHNRSSEEILDIYETRCVLEAMAGRVAAERRTDHDLRTLNRLIELELDVDSSNPRAMSDHNRRIHSAIWQASHNEPLIDLLQRLDLHLGRYPATTLAYPNRWEESLEQHRALVDAISQRDALAADRIASEHFLKARDIRLKLSYDELAIS